MAEQPRATLGERPDGIVFSRNLVTRSHPAFRASNGDRVEAREWQEIDPTWPVVGTKGSLRAAGPTEESVRSMIEMMEAARG